MQPVARRAFTSAVRRRLPLRERPSPPRLPEHDQKVFEQLQRSSTGAFSTPRPATDAAPPPATIARPKINQSPHASAPAQGGEAAPLESRVHRAVEKEERHPVGGGGARPVFVGEGNPRTGEVGGPKNEPLRWGGEVDWSYNGRVTDF